MPQSNMTPTGHSGVIDYRSGFSIPFSGQNETEVVSKTPEVTNIKLPGDSNSMISVSYAKVSPAPIPVPLDQMASEIAHQMSNARHGKTMSKSATISTTQYNPYDTKYGSRNMQTDKYRTMAKDSVDDLINNVARQEQQIQIITNDLMNQNEKVQLLSSGMRGYRDELDNVSNSIEHHQNDLDTVNAGMRNHTSNLRVMAEGMQNHTAHISEMTMELRGLNDESGIVEDGLRNHTSHIREMSYGMREHTDFLKDKVHHMERVMNRLEMTPNDPYR